MDEDPRIYSPAPPGGFFFIGWALLVLVVLGLTAGLVLARGFLLSRQTTQLEEQLQMGPRVLVEPVLSTPPTRSIVVPGTIHGYVETPVYAKIAGYLKAIYVDKGDRVKENQLLALLQSPELDHQVANARATYRLARITDQRNQSLLRFGVLAQQQADNSHAQLVEAKEALDQLIATKGYEEIRAPFGGIVTTRYVDPGALIPQATQPGVAVTPIIALATLSPLRIYADVPQSAAPFVRDGDQATITVTEYPQRVFKGTVARRSNSLVSETRTMLTEVDLPNLDGALYPGMYATMKFDVNVPRGVPLVPDDALIFRNGMPNVPVVRNGRLKLVPVTLGYDNGVNVEVPEGLSEQDQVAINVGQAAQDGEPVRAVPAASVAAK
ncbi:MAG TPA: efflux RND transporter periplasmic adaptor subunit [Candidatus Binataceae bacterium]|nr:efflux RND transporter periplasmic adaptor subunit [Candidatus Binataceae bacterium]